ncbi:hypothetical protein BKA67DRAFT_334682 [Truncatella angustata]|uniref:Uncharacterized protein n=1 Tax=Truncatella angustata TaxID=152316 RepID=A0A9P8UGB0_9PEZI|nr:uncharacterized protein BKA67DRAFT_334682 [Truncatella angustata]KAH6651684.1 hypothetical protein BKA67DRAFT_334682 [Truncatella angustata]
MGRVPILPVPCSAPPWLSFISVSSGRQRRRYLNHRAAFWAFTLDCLPRVPNLHRCLLTLVCTYHIQSIPLGVTAKRISRKTDRQHRYEHARIFNLRRICTDLARASILAHELVAQHQLDWRPLRCNEEDILETVLLPSIPRYPSAFRTCECLAVHVLEGSRLAVLHQGVEFTAPDHVGVDPIDWRPCVLFHSHVVFPYSSLATNKNDRPPLSVAVTTCLTSALRTIGIRLRHIGSTREILRSYHSRPCSQKILLRQDSRHESQYEMGLLPLSPPRCSQIWLCCLAEAYLRL